MNRKLTAALLILAAVLANVAFTALGSIFNYPDVLDEPAGSVLASFREHEDAVSAWFIVLALSAALMAPIAIGVGRLSSDPRMRIAVWVGIAAAVVQVIGLARWPILVPGYAADGDTSGFSTASDILGTAIRIARAVDSRPTPIAIGAISAAASARTANQVLTAPSCSRNEASTVPAGSLSTSG